MTAMAGSSSSGDGQIKPSDQPTDYLKTLYPAVNEDETPLPRSWSPKDKFNYIGLSQNNLRVHYKGLGKTHKDAASVRATHPIPASCGIYYFEVKIISKGRDGYMGIGLSVQGVNLNRLPGWDKHSYGYHGDDGNSFCSSGTGQPYGPTFSTGDVIGCCVNLIDSTCFYTKNGVSLGTAFRDLPNNLYATVGLQTPGEVIEANFGQSPFIFDIEDYMREWRMKTQHTVERFPVDERRGEWQATLQKMVSTYLVHHGYCATAESFARSTGQAFEEELASIKNRQRIQRLVLAGRVGEAIDTTQQLYPGLLDQDPNLLFTLKCRQFIEMVNGTDSEVRPTLRSPRSQTGSARSSPSPPVHLLCMPARPNTHIVPKALPPTTTVALSPPASSSSSSSTSSSSSSTPSTGEAPASSSLSQEEVVMNKVNSAMNGADDTESDVDMDTCGDDDDEEEEAEEEQVRPVSNGCVNGQQINNQHEPDDEEEDEDDDMELDSSMPAQRRQPCGGSQGAIERMLSFGRELYIMSEKLKHEYGASDANSRQLQDAFSLLAYADPWSSPVGHQLDPVQREPVCAALNSAILESHGLPKQPPLELAIGQASQCMRLMSKVGVGSCAFASVTDYLH